MNELRPPDKNRFTASFAAKFLTTLIIWGPPVAKARPRPGGKGRGSKGRKGGWHLPPQVRNYQKYISYMARQHWAFGPVEGPILLEIRIVRQMPRGRIKGFTHKVQPGEWHISTPDYDNYAKSITDGLNGVFWKDDRQVAVGFIVCRYGVRPRAEIDVWALGESPYKEAPDVVPEELELPPPPIDDEP